MSETVLLGWKEELPSESSATAELLKKPEAKIPGMSDLEHQFSESGKLIEDIVLKKYLHKLTDLEVIPLPDSFKQISDIRLFKITEMVYQKDEYSTYKFASVFSAVQNLNCGVFIIADSNGQKTEFYMGVRSLDEKRTTKSLKDTLKNALIGQFPGVKSVDLLDSQAEAFLSAISVQNISSVSCVANNKDEDFTDNETFIQGLEKLALAMQGQIYTAIVLAKSTPPSQLDEIRRAYETIYTQLSPFANMQLSYGSNIALSISNAFSHGRTSGISYTKNTGSSKGTSYSKGCVETESISKTDTSEALIKTAGIALLGVADMAAAPSAEEKQSIDFIKLITASGGIALGAYNPSTNSKGYSTNENYSVNETINIGENFGKNKSTSDSRTQTQGYTSGTSENMQLTMQNKTLIDILARIDSQLKRLEECESLGMWEAAAYFLSDSQETSEMAAGTYKALMKGAKSCVETSAINYWGRYDKDKLSLLREYIINFIHPVFSYRSENAELPVTAASLVSSNELAIQMGLPRKSVCGFPVIEHADFGKEVVSYGKKIGGKEIRLGKIFSMGIENTMEVNLDIDSFTMHTFITGSTGAGKSTAIYKILTEAVGKYYGTRKREDIHFLVVEPAKGEYKNIFGHWKDVFVYGTNPKLTPLLRINPFRFPAGQIHIYEHMDKLTEIFNVCWPMYAAMPAVLKAAIENAYKSAGWDLMKSENKHGDIFPTFKDVADEVEKYINKSEYSEENKSNYKGSLLTRLESLTNGINSMLFSNDDIEDEELFDRNVIVDLSRVGSSETKSLIMGMLILKLQEYRISKAKGMNQGLRHITVLEEAHNILKKTSTEQSEEGANLAGKSVEMLANSIAEMRTYGEGFIIADQAPGLLDPAVIRNTNTKIILRLPEFSDRELVGKAAALNDEQIIELAKLPKGVAAVYQNDWIEPVLCKIDKFEAQEKEYCVPEYTESFDNGKRASTILINFVARNRLDNPDAISDKQIRWAIEKCQCTARVKIKLYMLIEEYRRNHKLSLWQQENFSKQAFLVQDILCLDKAVESAKQMSIDFIDFNCYLNTLVAQRIEKASDDLILNIDHCLLKAYSEMKADGVEDYKAWYNAIIERGRLM